jgi:hypothetical protein
MDCNTEFLGPLLSFRMSSNKHNTTKSPTKQWPNWYNSYPESLLEHYFEFLRLPQSDQANCTS